MDTLGLVAKSRQFPDIAKSLLCYDESIEFCPEEFEKCLDKSLPDCSEFEKVQAHSWFMEYVKENPQDEAFPGGCRIKALFQFCTGLQVPPPGERHPKISLLYLPDDDTYQMPLAQACMGYLRIPVVHSTKAKFYEMMDLALKFECTGFGSI